MALIKRFSRSFRNFNPNPKVVLNEHYKKCMLDTLPKEQNRRNVTVPRILKDKKTKSSKIIVDELNKKKPEEQINTPSESCIYCNQYVPKPCVYNTDALSCQRYFVDL
jgi:hypothetical protein